MSLTGKNILITRPLAQGESLRQLILDQGGAAWLYPVMDIVAIDADNDPEISEHCKQLIMNLDQFEHIIFVSTNAVNYGLQWIDQYWAQLPIDINWYGIGKATSSLLASAGIPVATTFGSSEQATMNSEELLQHEGLQQLAGQKILIIRGVGGRDYLSTHLTQRGAKVSVAECYRRNIVNKPTGEIAKFIEEKKINVICVNSGESLQNFYQLAGESALTALLNVSIVVPGQRVANIAKECGFETIIIAENASDEAVFKTLQSY